MTESEWLVSEINRLQRANGRLKWALYCVTAFIVIMSLLFFLYSERQQRRLNEAWSQLKCLGGEEPEVSLARFQQIKLDMELGQVESIMGFRGTPGMGSEGEWSYSWRMDGNMVGVQINIEGRVKCAYLITANGQQHWLERAN